jgi:hypothetical protein
MKAKKSQIAATSRERQAYCAHKIRQGESMWEVGTCSERRSAESGVEPFEESIRLGILLRMFSNDG